MPFIIGILCMLVLGNVAGYFIQKARLRKLKKASPRKPLYAVQDDFSAAEFGCIFTGSVGVNQVVAEIVQLAMQGHVALSRNPAGGVIIRKTHRDHSGVNPVQTVILQGIQDDTIDLECLCITVDQTVQTLLTQKGILRNIKQPLRAWTDLTPRQAIRWTIVGLSALVAGIALGIGLDIGLRWAVVATILIELAVCVGIIMAVIFNGEMVTRARYVLAATDAYVNKWQDVYGVYEYIKTSGMDVFTPDYDTLNFKGLDALYPYAVAVGLDKQLVMLFE